MPKAMFGIPGFNPWNLLFVNICIAAIIDIRSETENVRMPKRIKILLSFYLFVVVLAFFREVFDDQGLRQMQLYLSSLENIDIVGKKDLFIEDVLNTIKYALPGILLFYGCNNHRRFKMACVTILLMNFILALLIIKVMPFDALTDGRMLEQTAMRKIGRDIGYYRSDLAILLSGAAWAMFAYRYTMKNVVLKMGTLVASGLTVLAIALTGGRIGMGAWIAVGLLLAFYRSRRLLFVGPILVLILISTVPSVKDRFTQGFSRDNSVSSYSSSAEAVDMTSVTSGRTIIWPYVVDKIMQAPFLGYGRRAMLRISLSTWLAIELNEVFPHPHNAYLEFLLDNGFVLAVPVFIFYFILIKYSFRLLKEKNDTVANTAGLMGLTFIFSFLLGGIAQQSFYPIASAMSMWCVIGIVLRIYREKYLVMHDEKISIESGKTFAESN